MPSRLRRAAQPHGDVAVGTFLNHPQLQQFAIPLRQRREYATLRIRERPTVVDFVQSSIAGEQARHTEPTASGVLDPPLTQRLAQHVPRDPKQPRQRGLAALVSEAAFREPRPCEHLGCQIGGMLADPRPRPRENLSGVSVIDLLEPIGSTRLEEFRVRRSYQLASHNLYLTLQRKMCQASRSLREVQRLRWLEVPGKRGWRSLATA